MYQIYPRTGADANSDGIGDLASIISRVDYLDRPGIDALWLSPFYPSTLVDYRDVDPTIGMWSLVLASECSTQHRTLTRF